MMHMKNFLIFLNVFFDRFLCYLFFFFQKLRFSLPATKSTHFKCAVLTNVQSNRSSNKDIECFFILESFPRLFPVNSFISLPRRPLSTACYFRPDFANCFTTSIESTYLQFLMKFSPLFRAFTNTLALLASICFPSVKICDTCLGLLMQQHPTCSNDFVFNH